jgi:hypothetical protein
MKLIGELGFSTQNVILLVVQFCHNTDLFLALPFLLYEHSKVRRSPLCAVSYFSLPPSGLQVPLSLLLVSWAVHVT